MPSEEPLDVYKNPFPFLTLGRTLIHQSNAGKKAFQWSHAIYHKKKNDLNNSALRSSSALRLSLWNKSPDVCLFVSKI